VSAGTAAGAALLALLPLLASGCRSLDPARRVTRVEESAVETSSGVTYEDLFAGSGATAVPGDTLLADYVVRLTDGLVVDSTLDRGVPVRILLGEAFVRGLDDGLVGMRAGGRRRVTIPPELAYGDVGVPGLVPPGATLVVEVHALELRPHGH
jgi:FKBP-type peptidyl-prolyl cis-trans isomerase